MTAYFDFYTHSDDLNFAKAREIVDKYKNYSNKTFKTMFDKIKQQLDEVDEMKTAKKPPQGEPEATTIGLPETASNRTKDLTPIIQNIVLDENTGQLSVTCQNIYKLTVKYYLIDAEILFSRSPFVKDQTEQFSYVMPFKSIVQQTNDNGDTRIDLPADLKGKNLVIEVNSDDIQ